MRMNRIVPEDLILDLSTSWRGSGRVRSTWPRNLIIDIARKISDPEANCLRTINFYDIEYALLNYCTEMERRAIYAKYRQGLSVKDIAAVLGVGISTICNAMNNATFMCKVYLLCIKPAASRNLHSIYLLYPRVHKHTIYILHRNHIHTIERLKNMQLEDLIKYDYIGPVIAKDVISAVKDYYKKDED